ncbi:GAF domain-containing sensor histidine kinase [Actinocrinis puniceicyclus]|uniref:Oxygen sensor histidine kinase NreB n=1 Tax=Actinocrinis puniceicyclus TaxID=977794 RepID=A0A8J7WQ80_9ACTN|nr:GAF domain-containing sensor histidine kinase [Actinocrinis puniceicyclus]MBS2964347.1 GAF domain-containing sensor histidine kinase [Actinocrinis puniceicyclus]
MSTTADRSQALATLHELSQAVLTISRHLDTGEALRRIVRAARELVGAEYAALGVPDGAGSFARFLVEGMTDEQWAAMGPLPRQHGMLSVILHDPRPQRLDDITADPRFAWWPAAHPRLTAFLGVPIRDCDEILGALFLGNTAPPGNGRGFTEQDEELLTVLAAHAAIALTHARLYERERELAIAEERTRLARELHDAVAQKLFALRLTAEAAGGLVDSDPRRARLHLGQISALAKDAAEELRAAVGELRPAELDEDGLAVAMRKQIDVLDRAQQSRGGPRVTFRDEPISALPPAHEQVVLRVAQEALHNALRHARAKRIEITLGPLPRGGARLSVVDDGVGFETQAGAGAGAATNANAAERGLGLASMRERADSVGGRVLVTSAPGEGTAVRLEVPGGRPA